jgi:hypothetical protein
LKLRKLGDQEPLLRNWDTICKVILGKPAKKVFDLLGFHQTWAQLAEIGFDQQTLRRSEEAVDREFNYADPQAFNRWHTKRAITSYRHFRMWTRKASI